MSTSGFNCPLLAISPPFTRGNQVSLIYPFYIFFLNILFPGFDYREGFLHSDKLNPSLCTFQYPVRAVYRVWPTVTGPSGEDAGFHHHSWQFGTGTCPSPGPVAATGWSQSSTTRTAQHSSHHHHDYNHSSQDHHHHKTYNQLQEGCSCEFDTEMCLINASH